MTDKRLAEGIKKRIEIHELYIKLTGSGTEDDLAIAAFKIALEVLTSKSDKENYNAQPDT